MSNTEKYGGSEGVHYEAGLNELTAPQFRRERHCFLLIDMQPGFFGCIKKPVRELIIHSQMNVLEYCAQQDVPAILLEFSNRSPTYYPLEDYWKKVPRRARFQKPKWDGFDNPNLERAIEDFGVDHVVVAGIESDFCVFDTAKGALDRKLKIVTAGDLIANRYSGREYEEELSPTAGPPYKEIEKDFGVDEFLKKQRTTSGRWYVENGLYFNTHQELLANLDEVIPVRI